MAVAPGCDTSIFLMQAGIVAGTGTDKGNITMVLFRFFPPSSRIFSLIFISFKDLYVFASIVFLIESFWWVCSTFYPISRGRRDYWFPQFMFL